VTRTSEFHRLRRCRPRPRCTIGAFHGVSSTIARATSPWMVAGFEPPIDADGIGEQAREHGERDEDQQCLVDPPPSRRIRRLRLCHGGLARDSAVLVRTASSERVVRVVAWIESVFSVKAMMPRRISDKPGREASVIESGKESGAKWSRLAALGLSMPMRSACMEPGSRGHRIP
jgi:hypothetical protein